MNADHKADRMLSSKKSMTPNEIEAEFWHLCQLADQADTIESSVPDLEPMLLDLLNFIKCHTDHQELFIKCFCMLVSGEKNCSEWILLFCMRELQYPEVQQALNERFDRLGGPNTGPGARLMNFVSDMNWAYDAAPWESSIFFKYFWQKEHPNEPWPIDEKCVLKS